MVEGAFLSDDDVHKLTYTGPTAPRSTQPHGTGSDVSLFRLRRVGSH